MAKKQKRPQAQKHYEQRKSLAHAATSRPSGNDYKRKPKYPQKGWE